MPLETWLPRSQQLLHGAASMVVLVLILAAFHLGEAQQQVQQQQGALQQAPQQASRPVLRWGQSNTTVFVTVEPPRGGAALPECSGGNDGSGGSEMQVEGLAEGGRILLAGGCSTDKEKLLRWTLDLREDIVLSGSHWNVGKRANSQLLVLEKWAPHRWDRLLADERQATVLKDWHREQADLPDEDEVELPRTQLVQRFSYTQLQEAAKNNTVVVAMRFPWCSVCEEKDKAFVKASKVAKNKEKLSSSSLTWAFLDLRSEKEAARTFFRERGETLQLCKKDDCPIHVFKPDEPFDEPYRIQMQLLYEMDEMAMMSDPVIGTPGYKPKNQATKPNFERFERDLERLLPAAVLQDLPPPLPSSSSSSVSSPSPSASAVTKASASPSASSSAAASAPAAASPVADSAGLGIDEDEEEPLDAQAKEEGGEEEQQLLSPVASLPKKEMQIMQKWRARLPSSPLVLALGPSTSTTSPSNLEVEIEVESSGLDATGFRRAARTLRTWAVFANASSSSSSLSSLPVGAGGLEDSSIWIWSPGMSPVRFAGVLGPVLDVEELVHFVRVHSQPIVQQYSWDLKDTLNSIGMPIAILWANFSDAKHSNTTDKAMRVFEKLCRRRRGTNETKHALCVTMDESFAYHQREYGTHDPYPFPFVGVTRHLGFGEGDRYGYPFKDPANVTVHTFFKNAKKSGRQLNQWLDRVLRGAVAPSHESGPLKGGGGAGASGGDSNSGSSSSSSSSAVSGSSGSMAAGKWRRGEVQDIVWNSYQREINGSSADILLELYDDQRKQSYVLEATMRIVAATLKDYNRLKVARMETSQNYVPPAFRREKLSKETEYYYVAPSLSEGQWTLSDPVKYTGVLPATPGSLLRFLKGHTLSSWSLKEALEIADDLSAEVMGQAKQDQRVVDRAEEDKQQMIKKMMTSLKKEKGLVDVGEMMGLKQAADTLKEGEDENQAKSDDERSRSSKEKRQRQGKEEDNNKNNKNNNKKQKPEEEKTKKKTKAAKAKSEEEPPEEAEARRAERRLKLEQEEERARELDRKDKEKRKRRKEEEKRKKEEKKRRESEVRAQEAAERERKRKKLEEELAKLPTNATFSWGQSKDSIRIDVKIPRLDAASLSVVLTDDAVNVTGMDIRQRRYELHIDLREFVVASNSSYELHYSEESLTPTLDGVSLNLEKEVHHRWDRLAQNHGQVKPWMRKNWVKDDGDLEEEKEDVDLPTGANLKKVTSATLQKLVDEQSMVLVAPRFPWCDKCLEKDREFAKAARSMKDKDHLAKVGFATLDVREEKHFARRHNYSCSDECELLIFKGDEPEEPYKIPGRRFMEELQIDCYKHLLPVVNVVEDEAAFKRVTSAFDTAVVAFFKGPRADSAGFRSLRAAARKLRGLALVGAVFGGRHPRDFGIDYQGTGWTAEKPLVLLFKPKEERHIEFRGEVSVESLSRFSRLLSLPLISTYNFETRQKFQELKVPLGMLWLDGENEDSDANRQAKRVLTRLAHQFSGQLVFVVLNNTRDAILMRPMGLHPRRVPAFGISATDEAESSRFSFGTKAPEFWSAEDAAFQELRNFCGAYLDGSLETSHESGELPPHHKWGGPGYVEEVVWKNFREAVLNTEHDVLLELYSPFRPQHRSFLSATDLVAEALKDVPNFKVVRMDTANNYVHPMFGLKEKDKASHFYFLAATPASSSSSSIDSALDRAAESSSTEDAGAEAAGAAEEASTAAAANAPAKAERRQEAAATPSERRPKKFGGRGSGKAEALPEKLVHFVHRETAGYATWDLQERASWTLREGGRRIRRLRALEKDHEKKMQDEWMQKEMEEFERYKRLGKFDNLPPMT